VRDLSGLKVLVADDDHSIRLLLYQMLSELGMQVTVAENGQEALELAKRESPHVLILDNRMPHVLGTEVAARVRWEGWGASSTIVIASSDAPPEPDESGLRCFDAWITKPFTALCLTQKLLELVNVKSRPRQPS
jgi:CheY-like chemotaxis protein